MPHQQTPWSFPPVRPWWANRPGSLNTLRLPYGVPESILSMSLVGDVAPMAGGTQGRSHAKAAGHSRGGQTQVCVFGPLCPWGFSRIYFLPPSDQPQGSSPTHTLCGWQGCTHVEHVIKSRHPLGGTITSCCRCRNHMDLGQTGGACAPCLYP